MRMNVRVLLVFALCAGFAAGSAAAQQRSGLQAFEAAASIADIDGSSGRVWIVRRAAPNEERTARVGEFLYLGDKVYVRGEGMIAEIQVTGSAGPDYVREGNSPYLVAPARAPSLREAVAAFLDGISWPWSGKAGKPRDPTSGRGVPGRAGGAPWLPVRSSALLSADTMLLPADLDRLTISWCGDAAYGEAHLADGEVIWIRDEGNVARIGRPVASRLDRIVIHDLGSAGQLRFQVRHVDARRIPRPQWLPQPPVSIEEQVAWGVWLLREAPAAYRAYGLTLLDGHRAGFPAAEQYFRSAVACGDDGAESAPA